MKRGIALAGGCRGGMDPGPAQPPGAAPRDVHGLAAGRTARRRMGIHRRTTKALWPVGQDGGRCAINAPGKLTAPFLGKGAKRDREQVKGKRTRG